MANFLLTYSDYFWYCILKLSNKHINVYSHSYDFTPAKWNNVPEFPPTKYLFEVYPESQVYNEVLPSSTFTYKSSVPSVTLNIFIWLPPQAIAVYLELWQNWAQNKNAFEC